MQNDTRAEIARLEERIKAIHFILDEREKQARAAIAGSQKAADKAEMAQERINLVSNEWRASLKDAQNNFPSKPELSALSDRVVNIEKALAGGAGRSGGRESMGELFLKILPLLISAAVLVLLFMRR